MDLSGGLLFRVDSHGKTENVPQTEDLLRVFRVADPGDGMQIGVNTMSGGAAKQVDLVRVGHSDQQLRVLHTGLLQHLQRSAVSVDSTHIKPLHAAFQHRKILVNDGQIMTLGG